jgi:hypothetical protein
MLGELDRLAVYDEAVRHLLSGLIAEYRRYAVAELQGQPDQLRP